MSAIATLPSRPARVVAWSRLGDEALAGRAAGGSTAAFSALYERYHGPLLGYTRSILLNAEDANDATQNALESALRALPSRDTSRPLRPWLYKIAHNEAIDIMRRRRPQTELQPAFEPTVPGPEVDAEVRGRLEQLVDDLQSLPERQRGALVMRELNGLSYDEIGTALGLTNEAARRAVFDARNALHDAADGRATACTSVRHSISDGDRRSLRARGIRAHLRSCDDCASFQRSIRSRRGDLHLLAPWVSGAAVIGAIGIGAGGSGGALLAAGSGASAAAGGGGGLGWAGLPMAIKGLAVAAAVATTGSAAVEIQHVAKPDRRTDAAQSASARPAPVTATASAAALRAAARAAAASRSVAASSVTRARTGNHVRATGSGLRSSGATRSTATAHSVAPLLAPAATVRHNPLPVVVAPPAPTEHAAPVVKKPAETAVQKLNRLQQLVQQAYADAQAVGADGSTDALALATGLLDKTLAPLISSIDRVLASLGLTMPSLVPASAPVAAPKPTTQTVLAPVQQVLDGVQSLIQKLLGQR